MSGTSASLVQTIGRAKKGSSTSRGSARDTASSSRGSQCTSRSRRRTLRASVADLSSGNVCAPHTPLLPTSVARPTVVVLEPAPNMRTLYACVVDDVLVTAHRNGIRLYRSDESLSSPISTASQGLWRLAETRDTFDLKDSYYCAAAQPLMTTQKGVCRTKYTRYFCVASGSDRNVHSLSVMSTRAHFRVHHTLHQHNRICAVHLAQVAFQPFREDAQLAMAASADEVGGLCLFDVEQERGFGLEQLARPAPREVTATKLHTWIEAAGHAEDQRAAYRFTRGIVTKIALVGPCLELCSGCQNACSPDNAGSTAVSAAHRRPSLVLMSLVLTARGPDVTAEEAADAHLRVTLVRVVLTDKGAFVLSETTLMETVAPVRVCECGPALCAPPYQSGLPMSVYLGEPRLTVSCRRGCCGEALHVYRNPSSESRGNGEYCVQWEQLGLRKLSVSGKMHTVPTTPSGAHLLGAWDCALTLTSDGSVLLVGRESDGAAEATCGGGLATLAVPPAAVQDSTGPLDGGEGLNAWLDDIELPPESPVSDDVPPLRNSPSPASASPAPERSPDASVYTVLSEIFNVSRGQWQQTPHHFSVDWKQNCVLLFMPDNETVLSVQLPVSPPLALASPSKENGAAPAGSTTAPEVKRRDETPLEAPAELAGGALGFASSMWHNTTKGLSTAVSSATVGTRWGMPTSWSKPSFYPWHGNSTSASPQRDVAPSADTTASPQATSAHSREASVAPPRRNELDRTAPSHTYGIVRPIAVALAHLAGAASSSSSSSVAITSPRGVSGTSVMTSLEPTDAHVAESAAPLSPPPQPTSVPPSPRSVVSHSQPRVDISHTRRRNGKPSTASRSRRSAAAESVGSSLGASVSRVDIDLYTKNQVEQARGALTSPARSSLQAALTPTSASPSEQPDVILTATALNSQYAIQQLVDVDEPLARNAIVYAWRDYHDALFIRETAAREILESEARHGAVLETLRDAEMRELYGRRALVDIPHGKHSLQFLTSLNELLAKRERTHDRRGCFGFKAYFESAQVPQQLIDLQEQDKCRFELRDLERDQLEKLKALNPESVVEILQNEEKRVLPGGHGRTRWESHATFPYDDKDGHTVDLLVLNQQADTKAEREWRWKTDQDDFVTEFSIGVAATASPLVMAHMSGAASPRRAPQVVAKDLKGWCVGAWRYAHRWPTSQQERDDPNFWTAQERPTSKVRCRSLTRTRVHVPTDTKRKHLMEEHAKQLEALRLELDL